MTLIGRPGKIVEKGNVIITAMQSKKAPSLSKQLPTPPERPTNYVLLIARKQWNKVAEAIKDPEDVLVVEGYPQVDAKMKGITVFVQSATTKMLQRAKK